MRTWTTKVVWDPARRIWVETSWGSQFPVGSGAFTPRGIAQWHAKLSGMIWQQEMLRPPPFLWLFWWVWGTFPTETPNRARWMLVSKTPNYYPT